MAKYVPIVDALRWLGTNALEMRQFIAQSRGLIRTATVRDGVLYLQSSIMGWPEQPIEVGHWVVLAGLQVLDVLDEDFQISYAPAPAPAAPSGATR